MPANNNLAGFEVFEEVERAIVVAAHADDLETMCGGTMARLAQRGVKIYSVNCTAGDLGTQDPEMGRAALAKIRLTETEAAAYSLGLAETFNLGYPDGELVADLELRAQIARLYRLTQADTLFTFDPFWTGQVHPDHRAAGQAALDAYMPSKMPLYHPDHLREEGMEPACVKRIFFFGTEREPDVYVNVDEVYDLKLKASMAHQSQFPKGEESLDWMKERDKPAGQKSGATYAEVFKQLRVW